MNAGTLARESFRGPWAGLPVAWTEAGGFDEETYRIDVRRLRRCADARSLHGWDDRRVLRDGARRVPGHRGELTVEECHAGNIRAMIGCTSTYTMGACPRRIRRRYRG